MSFLVKESVVFLQKMIKDKKNSATHSGDGEILEFYPQINTDTHRFCIFELRNAFVYTQNILTIKISNL